MILSRHLIAVTFAVSCLPIIGAEPVKEPKLQMQKWSGAVNVPDPVAVTTDFKGRVYVTQTTRRKVADLDIREHPQWVPIDVALDDIEKKKAFYHDVLAPGKMLRPEGGLKDHNKDGSIDWRDLTVHSERIYRLEDTDGDGVADKKTVFAEGFNTEVTGIAAGILWHDGWVYCTIAPDLWRLRDNDDDGVADEREAIVHGFGHHIAYAGHDMHGLCVGPDGRIYWTIGDKGVNVLTKEGTRVMQPHQGCVLRCEPDGTGFEVFAHGLRNVQEVAFDEYGNLFGVDNDADKPGEKERIVYITEQSDSGWRCTYQYMKGYCPWMDEGLWKPRFKEQPEYITPPLANHNDGPAGFAYNPGTALSNSWKRMFFNNQFPKGRMNAFQLSPSGASFILGEDKVVASGVMGIGMSWTPDGKLIMADWGGDYPLNEIGAIWTLDDVTGTGSTERKETQKILQKGFAKAYPSELMDLLGHADKRVRLEAQFELVKRGEFEALKNIASDINRPQLARIHAIWGLGQAMRADKFEDASLLDALIKDKDNEVRCQTVKVIGDAKSLAGYGAKLVPLLKDSQGRLQFHAAIALGKLKVPVATPILIALAKQNADKDAFLRHALITGLAGCATSEILVKESKNDSRSVRVACAIALRRRSDMGIVSYLHDKDDGVVSEAARGIHDEASLSEAMGSLAETLAEPRIWPEAVTRRAINANFRLGGAAEMLRLVNYILNPKASLPLREEALNLVKLWIDPPLLDRVDGRAGSIRLLPTRSSNAVSEAVLPKMTKLMSLPEKELKTLVIQIFTTYKLPMEVSLATASVMEQSAPVEVRVEALHLLEDQHSTKKEFGETLNQLVADGVADKLRAVALQCLLKVDAERAVMVASQLVTKGTTLEKQVSLAVLSGSQSAAADEVLFQQMDLLTQGKIIAPIKLDLLEATAKRSESNAMLKEKLAASNAARALQPGTIAAFTECLEGGDAKLGRDIALENLTANCVACHRFESKEGSEVGPALNQIGRMLDRNHILEALVNPGARIAPGFGMVSVTLKDGQTVSGSLVLSNASEIQVRIADGTIQKISQTNVASKTDPISVMPPMSAILNKRQIRDVVAYLSELGKATAKPKKK